MYYDEIIKRQSEAFLKKKTRTYAETYEKDIAYRFDFVEKDCIKEKPKLMHIKERLNRMSD